MICIDRREYHAAQSGRFVARLQLVPEQLPGALWAPSPPDAGLELSLAEELDWGDYLPDRCGFILRLSCCSRGCAVGL